MNVLLLRGSLQKRVKQPWGKMESGCLWQQWDLWLTALDTHVTLVLKPLNIRPPQISLMLVPGVLLIFGDAIFG